MKARATSTEATRRRVLDAAVFLLKSRFRSEIRLEDVAVGAQVTVQTIINIFGGRSALFDRALKELLRDLRSQRLRPNPGDIKGAIAALVEHYEQFGDQKPGGERRSRTDRGREGRTPAMGAKAICTTNGQTGRKGSTLAHRSACLRLRCLRMEATPSRHGPITCGERRYDLRDGHSDCERSLIWPGFYFSPGMEPATSPRLWLLHRHLKAGVTR